MGQSTDALAINEVTGLCAGAFEASSTCIKCLLKYLR